MADHNDDITDRSAQLTSSTTGRVHPQISCKYGHGQMIGIEGNWTLVGVGPHSEAPTSRKLSAQEDNGLFFMVKAWRCRTCGYMEIFDSETPWEL